mmetsp:Transcript_37591/g.96174  ORF Transcript_37591/g.96174 Transcript_37591/m.96174 type:complete len:626 (-) Transcript_37591:411-2288(-)
MRGLPLRRQPLQQRFEPRLRNEQRRPPPLAVVGLSATGGDMAIWHRHAAGRSASRSDDSQVPQDDSDEEHDERKPKHLPAEHELLGLLGLLARLLRVASHLHDLLHVLGLDVLHGILHLGGLLLGDLHPRRLAHGRQRLWVHGVHHLGHHLDGVGVAHHVLLHALSLLRRHSGRPHPGAAAHAHAGPHLLHPHHVRRVHVLHHVRRHLHHLGRHHPRGHPAHLGHGGELLLRHPGQHVAHPRWNAGRSRCRGHGRRGRARALLLAGNIFDLHIVVDGGVRHGGLTRRRGRGGRGGAPRGRGAVHRAHALHVLRRHLGHHVRAHLHHLRRQLHTCGGPGRFGHRVQLLLRHTAQRVHHLLHGVWVLVHHLLHPLELVAAGHAARRAAARHLRRPLHLRRVHGLQHLVLLPHLLHRHARGRAAHGSHPLQVLVRHVLHHVRHHLACVGVLHHGRRLRRVARRRLPRHGHLRRQRGRRLRWLLDRPARLLQQPGDLFQLALDALVRGRRRHRAAKVRHRLAVRLERRVRLAAPVQRLHVAALLRQHLGAKRHRRVEGPQLEVAGGQVEGACLWCKEGEDPRGDQHHADVETAAPGEFTGIGQCRRGAGQEGGGLRELAFLSARASADA